MTENEIYNEAIQAGALLEGHFILSSGLHSPQYLQCARLMMYPKRAEKLCRALKNKVENMIRDSFDIIISPAMGGVIVGYEMGRQFTKPAIFLERVKGQFELRRGFSIPKKSRCLIVEDVVTTGLSSRETCDAISRYDGIPVALCCLFNRSGEDMITLNIPVISLLKLSIPVYDANNLPPALQAIPAVKPGSRTKENA